MSKQKLRVDERLAANAAALHLELLAAGLRKGKGFVMSRRQSLEFVLPPEVDFKLEVRNNASKSRGRVQIRLGWSVKQSARSEISPRAPESSGETA